MLYASLHADLYPGTGAAAEAGPADASKCWAAAMANCEVEDVADAVGLSIRLPGLTDVRVAHRNRLVTISAKRGILTLSRITKGPLTPAIVR